MYFWTWNMHHSISCIYILLRWTLRSRFLPRKVISLFFTIKFSGMKMLQMGDEFFLRFFLLIRAFFACFPFIKRPIVFIELLFDTPTQWHASIFFGDTLTLFSFKISKTFSSKSGIPVFSMLLQRPYCSSELCSLSKVKILFSRVFTFFLRCSFSTWRFLIIISFKFNN